MAKKFRVKSYYQDPMKLIERKDIEAIDICLPTYLHSKFIILAAKNGKHVFCEKPMTLSVREAEEVIHEAKKHGVKLMVGYNQRFQKPFEKIKEFIDSKLLGNLVLIESSYARCGPKERYLPPSWRAYPEKGGGVLLDLACHKVDLLRWFAGEAEEVTALKSRNFGTEAEDTAGIIIRFQGGTLGIINVSLAYASPYSELDITKVHGSRGSVRFSSENKKVVEIYIKKSIFAKSSKYITIDASSKKDPYVRELEVFVDSIIKDKNPPITGEDAKKVHEIIEAAREAAKSEKTIQLR